MFPGICFFKKWIKVNDFLPKYGSLNDRTISSYLFAHDLAYDLADYLAKVYDPDWSTIIHQTKTIIFRK